jgi:hypothetical protein
MIEIWKWIGRHGGGVQRREDWVGLLGNLFQRWQPFLKPVQDPVGIKFWASLRGGEEEHEITHDKEGYWAVPIDSGVPERLNATQAEFLRLDFDHLLEVIRDSVALEGTSSRLQKTAHAYQLGHKLVEGHTVIVFLVPSPVDLWSAEAERHFNPAPQLSTVSLALVPTPAEIPSAERVSLLARRILTGELPTQDPWAVDFTELATATGIGFEIQNLGKLCGQRFVLIIDKRQQKAWIEGQEIALRADSQPYRLLAHLAQGPGTSVPNRELANSVLSTNAAESTEGKIIDGAKDELRKKLDEALARVANPRVKARNLVVSDGGRQRLDLPVDLVLVRG